jgi:hypothetical protein
MAIGSMLSPEQASAKSWQAKQREAEYRARAWLGHVDKERLLEMMEQRDREISNQWPRFIEAYSRLCAAIAATGACTNFPTPPGPPVVTYDPVASGHAISPIFLSPGKVYQLSEASPFYRQIVWKITYNRNLAMTTYRRIQCLSFEKYLIELELHRRAGQNGGP